MCIRDSAEYVSVRGEVIFDLAGFERMNESRVERGDPAFKNPRNAAAGTVRQLDPEVAQGRPLQFFAHSAGEGIDTAGHHELMGRLVEMGFQMAELTRVCEGMDEVVEAIEAIGAARNDLPTRLMGRL